MRLATAALLRAVVFGCLLLPSAANAQEGTEIVRGRVLGPDGRPVQGAIVTITGPVTEAVRTTRTNDHGVYTALFGSGEGEYLVAVRTIGFAPATLRVTRTGDASVLVADVTLALLPVELEPVTVMAERPRPPRSPDRPSTGGVEREVLSGALFSLDPSDLTALAATVPGVLAIPGANGDPTAFSVLGAPPDQNNIVVDGSSFGGASLPRDALAGARLAATTYDPARGQFAGGQLAATTRGGRDLFQANLRGTLADPRLAWADPASPMPFSLTQSASGSAGGPIQRSRAHYFAAAELHRSTSEALSLLAPHPALFAQYGLSPDTVAALTTTLRALGVPLTTSAIPDDRVTDRQSAFVRLDFTPSATTSLTLRADGAWTRQGGAGIPPLGVPSLATESRTSQLGLQVSGSAYVRGILAEFKTYVQRWAFSSAPYLALPGGTVRASVRYGDGREGLTSFRFGGGSGGSSEHETLKWETTNELSWLTTDSRHRVKVGQLIALERTTSSQVADRFGTFTYQSLDDLVANHPASYTRTLTARERSGGMGNGAVWVGDEWRAATALRFQYGLRMDIGRPSTTPAYNPAIDSLFAVRTDRVPLDIGFSPRLGFAWVSGQGAGSRPRGPREGALATPAPGAWRPMIVSGGIGAFRGVIAPARIAGLVDATGLPSTTRYLTCVGDATPVPDWPSLGGAAPDSCRDGATPVEFSSSQPSVTVFDPSFRAPLSWRANVGIQGLLIRGWGLGVSGLYSVGLNGESGLDLNLRRTPAFTLADEGNRPVFVPPASIVAATGAIAPGASRVTDRFGRVTSVIADLRSIATQFQVTLAPVRPLFGKLFFNTSYTYAHHRAQERGFTGSTRGDPFIREWAPGPQPAHQIQAMTSGRLWWLAFGVRLNVTSGIAYTPLVAGDVNGDGMSNDRAFIFDPATTADSTVAAQMTALLASAPLRARTCLRAQLGRIAGRNSCRTGWHVRPDLNLNVAPPESFGIGDRLRVSLTMINATGALFRLLGLSDTPLARATALAPPDPRLLYVTGFDSASRHFRYRVNQQFGDAQDYGAPGRRFAAPFQAQIGLEYRFGGPPRDMMARSLGLVSTGGDPLLTEGQVRDRARRLHNDPIRLLLDRRDSLALTVEQVARLERIHAEFVAQSDSALAPLVAYVVARGRKVSDADLRDRLGRLFPEMRRLMLATARRGEEVLTPLQKDRLPSWYAGLAR